MFSRLEKKRAALLESFAEFEHELLKTSPSARAWTEVARSKHGACCEVKPVIGSPVINGYRNKCEFSIGDDVAGESKTVGFRLAKYLGYKYCTELIKLQTSSSSSKCKSVFILDIFKKITQN